jgi:hypothetical protein
MKKIVPIFIVFILFFLASFGQISKDSLYVFIGEKIEVTSWPQPKSSEHFDTTIVDGDTTLLKTVSVSMDARFICRYKIIRQVYGVLETDTIEFLAFDHFGTPAFSRYKYVMLFVTGVKGKLYHEKYQYFDVYKTKNGRWASSYKIGEYEHDYNRNTSVKPEVIEFLNPVSYNIKKRSKNDIEYLFPSPYFKIVRHKAVAVWGNYVEELFELKKGGVLKARGLF